jgi:hypothetical protein
VGILLHADKIWLDQLVKHVGHWSWFHILYSYNDTHLVIADKPFLDQLRRARKVNLQCRLASPENYQEEITDKIQKVLVFCQEKELAIVRDIQEKHPKVKVTSGTYGYALIGKDRYPRLKEFKAPVARKFSTPVLLLSTPYADAEFIANSLAENGLPYFHEYLARPFATWLQRHKHFQVTRFYEAAESHFAKDKPLHCLLQTDVMRSLFDHSSFSLGRFVRYLKASQAKVILVTRQDKVAQAVNGQLLYRTAERSVWTKKPKKKLQPSYIPEDMPGSARRQLGIGEDERLLGQIAASDVSTLQLELEDFVADQRGGLEKIAAFLGEKLSDHPVLLEYEAGYDTATDLPMAVKEYRRELVDRLGINGSVLP